MKARSNIDGGLIDEEKSNWLYNDGNNGWITSSLWWKR